GHHSVIDLARVEAQKLGAPLAVLTFEPHPRQVFKPDAPDFRLMHAAGKAHKLDQLGVDILYELPFSKDLAGLPPQAFAQEILAQGLGLRHAVVGADFCFGQGRTGTAQDLRKFGESLGYGVTIAELVQPSPEHPVISSTAIRSALSDGRPRDAAAMLGHLYRVEGQVLHGHKRGRELGFPTANQSITGLHLPKFGVYAVKVEICNGPHQGNYTGVASMGVRPMFGENSPNLETHIFDFAGDLYDAYISVGLVEYLRPEQKFDGLDGLIAQMNRDALAAKEILATA
ncbi:MAG: bifunctional riboflavin kinase/FAD synthetase, partial [Mangrovicoccus sp.]